MGWAEGSIVAEELWNTLCPYINKDERAEAEVSKRIYKIFEEHDADDWFYQLQYKDSLFDTYIRLNQPEKWKELLEELDDRK